MCKTRYVRSSVAMKILIVNDLLFPSGESENYIIMLGKHLKKMGHLVEYFGIDSKNRELENSTNTYIAEKDFHIKKGLSLTSTASNVICSIEARKKIRKVLDDFHPDVCHLNNVSYHLTPGIILEIAKWRNERKNKCRIIYTAHNYQLICPNQMLYNPNTEKNCEKCRFKKYLNCIKEKCIEDSAFKSFIGACNAKFCDMERVYWNLDAVICHSEFLKAKLGKDPIFENKAFLLPMFVHEGNALSRAQKPKKWTYVLYAGTYSKRNGTETLIEACKELPKIPFVFAGAGPKEIVEKIQKLPNAKEVGELSPNKLARAISGARFLIYPVEWNDICPTIVAKSQKMGTPVIGAKIGGVPELIENMRSGLLFKPGNKANLANMIKSLYENELLLNNMTQYCLEKDYMTLEAYCKELVRIYKGARKKNSNERNYKYLHM